MDIALPLAAWSAWAPDKTSTSDWQAWAESDSVHAGRAGNADTSATPAKPDISAIPAPNRRRLSNLSRMAFASAAQCSDSLRDQVCCIFASRHGELARTLDIVQTILANEDVSPTDFSHSVHSTSLGLFSIFVKNREASTLVTAGEDTFGMALLEVDIYLARFPGKPVLLVFFDEELPPPLAAAAKTVEDTFSLALLFEAGTAPNIGVRLSHNPAGRGDDRNPGLDFLKFHLSGATESTISTDRTHWRWKRLPTRAPVATL
jgi:hypothetical protein